MAAVGNRRRVVSDAVGRRRRCSQQHRTVAPEFHFAHTHVIGGAGREGDAAADGRPVTWRGQAGRRRIVNGRRGLRDGERLAAIVIVPLRELVAVFAATE